MGLAGGSLSTTSVFTVALDALTLLLNFRGSAEVGHLDRSVHGERSEGRGGAPVGEASLALPADQRGSVVGAYGRTPATLVPRGNHQRHWCLMFST